MVVPLRFVIYKNTQFTNLLETKPSGFSFRLLRDAQEKLKELDKTKFLNNYFYIQDLETQAKYFS